MTPSRLNAGCLASLAVRVATVRDGLDRLVGRGQTVSDTLCPVKPCCSTREGGRMKKNGAPMTVGARARQREIASAAAWLFSERGFHETGMEDIADAVNLSKPTLYHYVHSKGEIVYLIHEELIDMLTGRLRERIEDGVLPASFLHSVIADILSVMKSHPGHLKVYFEHHRDVPDEYQAGTRQKRQDYFNLVAGAIKDGVARGEFETDNPEITTFALFGMTNWSYQWYRPNRHLSPEQIADHFWKVFYQGLRREGT